MSVELKYKNPLTLELGTGVTGSINGESFSVREIQGLVDENVTLNIGQEVATTSNTTFTSASIILASGSTRFGDTLMILTSLQVV